DPRAESIIAFLRSFDVAFNSRDVARLAPLYHSDVTIFEGGVTNDGWADYRDNHIGPELKEMEDLQLSHFNVTPHLLASDADYVTAEYRLKARVEGRAIDASGLETLILLRDGSGAWKIRHSHTSSRKRAGEPAAGPSPKP